MTTNEKKLDGDISIGCCLSWLACLVSNLCWWIVSCFLESTNEAKSRARSPSGRESRSRALCKRHSPLRRLNDSDPKQAATNTLFWYVRWTDQSNARYSRLWMTSTRSGVEYLLNGGYWSGTKWPNVKPKLGKSIRNLTSKPGIKWMASGASMPSFTFNSFHQIIPLRRYSSASVGVGVSVFVHSIQTQQETQLFLFIFGR